MRLFPSMAILPSALSCQPLQQIGTRCHRSNPACLWHHLNQPARPHPLLRPHHGPPASFKDFQPLLHRFQAEEVQVPVPAVLLWAVQVSAELGPDLEPDLDLAWVVEP